MIAIAITLKVRKISSKMDNFDIEIKRIDRIDSESKFDIITPKGDSNKNDNPNSIKNIDVSDNIVTERDIDIDENITPMGDNVGEEGKRGDETNPNIANDDFIIDSEIPTVGI